MHFGSKSDPRLIDDMYIQDALLYLSRKEFGGTGQAAISGNDLTLTVTPSPAWTVDQFKSLGGLNLEFKDKDGDVFIAKVKSNTASGLVVDMTQARWIKDDSLGAPTDWVAGQSYDFFLFEPHPSYEVGYYFGQCKDIEFTPQKDYAKFKMGIPEKNFRKDLASAEYSIKGKNFSWPNRDVTKTILNTTTYGGQAGKWEEHFGSAPDPLAIYRLTAVGADVDGRETQIQLFMGQFGSDGSLSFASKEHKPLGFVFDALPDIFRPGNVDTGFIRRKD